MKRTKIYLTIIALAASTAAVMADAGATWEHTCQKCHGPDAKGHTKIGQKLSIKDLTDPNVQAAFTDADAFKALKDGLKDSEGKTRMKPLEGVSDDEIKALVGYVRTLKGK